MWLISWKILISRLRFAMTPSRDLTSIVIVKNPSLLQRSFGNFDSVCRDWFFAQNFVDLDASSKWQQVLRNVENVQGNYFALSLLVLQTPSLQAKHAAEEESGGGHLNKAQAPKLRKEVVQRSCASLCCACLHRKEAVGPWMLGRWSRALKVGLVGMPSLGHNAEAGDSFPFDVL